MTQPENKDQKPSSGGMNVKTAGTFGIDVVIKKSDGSVREHRVEADTKDSKESV